MAASETIIGEEWQARSREQYFSYKAMTLPMPLRWLGLGL